MEPKPPDLNRITVEILEARLSSIDLEIVELGENISPDKLRALTIEKGNLTKQVATLRGEPVERGKPNSIDINR